MTDRPILFNRQMVKAVLGNQKHQTRRIINPQPVPFEMENGEDSLVYPVKVEGRNYTDIALGSSKSTGVLTGQKLRYVVGDRFWVKEAHFAYGHWITTDELTRGGKPKRSFIRAWDVPVNFTEPTSALGDVTVDHQECWYKRNSLFMNKCDSRLTLPITDVRIQNVQDISEEDARDEGVNRRSPKVRQMWLFGADKAERERIYTQACKWEFEDLWNSINEPRGFGWDANPWVVAVTFETHKCNIDQMEATP